MRNGSRYESRYISNKVFFLYGILYSPNLRSKQVERKFYDMIKMYTNTQRAKVTLCVHVNGEEGEGKEEWMKHKTYLDCDFFYRLKKLLSLPVQQVEKVTFLTC